jgi:hypothetical protein
LRRTCICALSTCMSEQPSCRAYDRRLLPHPMPTKQSRQRSNSSVCAASLLSIDSSPLGKAWKRSQMRRAEMSRQACCHPFLLLSISSHLCCCCCRRLNRRRPSLLSARGPQTRPTTTRSRSPTGIGVMANEHGGGRTIPLQSCRRRRRRCRQAPVSPRRHGAQRVLSRKGSPAG